ncbi:hypothetical protein DFJ73DRAFT_757448 [Zopfochytrium polystomum]|nr:hypothetical protein DFJ73DRAFT_757448 [Zopfochytrium polystomum]
MGNLDPLLLVLLLVVVLSTAVAAADPTIIYSCNTTAFAPLPIPLPLQGTFPHQPADGREASPSSSSLPWPSPSTLLADLARLSSAPPGLSSTSYTHLSRIDGAAGAFHTDCSCYLSYLLAGATRDPSLLAAWAELPKDSARGVVPPSPRAGNYHRFLAGLAKQPRDGDDDGVRSSRWEAVATVAELRDGDLVSWAIPRPGGGDGSGDGGGGEDPGWDTGHVLVVGGGGGVHGPLTRLNESAYLVSVIDASSTRHEADTRCTAVEEDDFEAEDPADAEDDSGALRRRHSRRGGARFECRMGVGRGRIVLAAGADGAPRAFQFRQDSTPRWYPIAMGRLRSEP